jgi:hypothetical protein
MMELVKAETGLSPDMYYLVLNSRILHEGLTLKDVEATEIKLSVIVRGRGGVKRARATGEAGGAKVDKAAKIREIRDAVISTVAILQTPLYRCPEIDGMIQQLNHFEQALSQHEGFFKAMMQRVPRPILRDLLPQLDSTNNGARYTNLCKAIFYQGMHRVMHRKEGMKKMESLMSLVMEYALTFTYMKKDRVEWDVLSSDVLFCIENNLSDAMNAAEDDLTNRFRGLAM